MLDSTVRKPSFIERKCVFSHSSEQLGSGVEIWTGRFGRAVCTQASHRYTMQPANLPDLAVLFYSKKRYSERGITKIDNNINIVVLGESYHYYNLQRKLNKQ